MSGTDTWNQPAEACIYRCASDADCFLGWRCDLSLVAQGRLDVGTCRVGNPCTSDADCTEGLCILDLGVCGRPSYVPSSF